MTLFDTDVNESRKKMADHVTRSPFGLCSTDGKLCYYRRLEYDFFILFLAFFSFSSLAPSLSWYISLLRIASSAQQSSAPRQQVHALLVPFVF